MPVAADTKLTFSSVENKEDLSEIVVRIAPDETPFFSNTEKTEATGTFHEWVDESLNAAVDTNANLEGDEATNDAVTPKTRPGNYTQIADKVAQVSGTQQSVDQVGGRTAMARERIAKGVELRTDIEKQVLSNKPSVAGDSTTARQSASFESFITSNASRGSGGANGGFSAGIVAAPTDGTQRAFTETLMLDVLDTAFTNGARPKIAYMSAFQKRAFSAFAGIADIRRDAPGTSQATVVGAADRYIGNYGPIDAVPSQFVRSRTVSFADPDRVKIAIIAGRNFMSSPLAKSGDYMREQILTEYCLEINEKGNATCSDLTTS